MENQILEDTIESVDVQIGELMAAVRRLKSRRNLVVPISKLPQEVLSKIFLRVRDEIVRQAPEHKEWLAIAQTCEYWRMITFSTAQFWSHIDIVPKSKNWAKELLTRCGPNGWISLVSLWRIKGEADFVAQIWALQLRLKKLTIVRDWRCTQYHDDDADLRDLAPSNLEYLSVKEDHPLYLSIDSRILLHCQQTLKHLHLDRGLLRPTPSGVLCDGPGLFRGLRTLSIKYGDSLFYTLPRICNVEEVKLVRAVPIGSQRKYQETSFFPPAWDVGYYPRLRRTIINDGSDAVMSLLRTLKPKQGTLNVTCHTTSWCAHRDNFEAKCHEVAETVAEAMRRVANGQPFRRVSFRLFSKYETYSLHTVLVIEAWTFDQPLNMRLASFEMLQAASEPSISFSFYLPEELKYANNNRWKNALIPLYDALRVYSTPAVCALVQKANKPFIVDAFGTLVALRLSAGGSLFFVSLKDLVHELKAGSGDRPIVNHLETLAIYVDQASNLEQEDGWVALWLRARASRGYPVPTVLLAFPGNLYKRGEDWAESLRELGCEVHCHAEFPDMFPDDKE